MKGDGVIKEFVRHLFPRRVLGENLKITYTFCLGGLAFTCFLRCSWPIILARFGYRDSTRFPKPMIVMHKLLTSFIVHSYYLAVYLIEQKVGKPSYYAGEGHANS